MTTTISRLYDDYATALQAVRRLKDAGVPNNEISIVSNNSEAWQDADTKRIKHRDLKHAEETGDNAGIGAGIGAALGGTAGVLTGLGLLAIPGLGPVVAAGWLATAALGLAAGGVAGGLIGALTSSGVSETDAHFYAEGIRRGGTLVSARVPDRDRARIESIMNDAAVNMREREAYYRSSGWSRFDENAAPFSAAEIRQERLRTSTDGQLSESEQVEVLSSENAQLRQMLSDAMLENARLKGQTG
jgi:hypothetical protein